MLGDKVISSQNPFDLSNQQAYGIWRQQKLENYPTDVQNLIVEVNDPRSLSKTERQEINRICNKTNMAVYISKEGANSDKRNARFLAEQLGLKTLDKNMGADDDGITSLQVASDAGHERYIPYTNKAIHWHTDGYYNTRDKQIHALNLHCVRPAKQGGENALMDHEIAYIRLRDKNPDYIHALMSPTAMTIPANIKDGEEIRPERTGPVFSVTKSGALHMRYTERAHNIVWSSDLITLQAVEYLESILNSDEAYIYRLILQPGWGLISNNVLHDRGEFNDDKSAPRLLYRLRYYEELNLR